MFRLIVGFKLYLFLTVFMRVSEAEGVNVIGNLFWYSVFELTCTRL